MKIYYHILLLFVTLTSCETIVDVDIPREAPKLVANAIINPDSLIKVHISQSQYVLDDTEFKSINDANVSIFEEGVLKEQLTRTQTDGIYISQFTPQIGKPYTLTAEATNFAPIEATTTLHPKVPIQSIALDSLLEEVSRHCVDDSCTIYYFTYYEFGLTLQDPANIPNYYSVSGFHKYTHTYREYHPDGSFEEKTEENIVTLYLSSEDASLALSEFDMEGNSFWGSELFFSDEIFDGQTYTFNFEIGNSMSNHPNGEFIIILKHLTEEQFQYEVSKKLQSLNNGNPFSEPVPVYNNIENGYGIFAGYSADTKIVKP